uniref:C2H2-type domain-containing protein n=2 Tax=Schistocephalus solidus TaxID=70667 RepID=A0A0X3NM35_SCHSO
MTMTQTATKELLFTSCDGRVAVDVQRVDQGRDPTEAHQPSTLPPVDSIEQTPEVPAYTDHVCQVCSASFTADTLLQENINSEHFPVEDGEARRTLSELDEKGPGGATTAISLSGTLDEEEEEETECTDKDTEAGQCAGTTTESQALKVVVCKLCRISFRNSEFLQRHERTSTQHAKKVKLLAKVRTRIRKSQVALGGLAVYCCTDCSLTYARKQSLDRHISVVHHREATFACEYCEFEASDRATFSEHMARHFHLKDVACEFCNHRCISKRELKDHILFKHQDERSYACPLCAKTFKTAGTLSRHRRTHTNISYTCELCSAKFNRQSNLTRHMRTVHTSDTRRRRGRKRAIRGTASPPVGPSPLLPIRPKCATATEVMIPAAVESQDGTFDAIIDCNALPPSDASVPVEVAGFVSIAQVGALPSDLSSPEVHQKAQPEPPDSIYFVSCSPTTMPSSSVNVSSTSLVNARSFSVSFPSAEEHTSLDVDDDGQSRDVNVDAVARPLSVLAADQGGACPGILNSSPNEASFRRSDLHKTSESHIPSESGHLSVLPCVSDLFFSDASTIAERTITQSSFVDGNRDTVHVCFSSDLAPISSCSRPIWRPLDDLQHPQNSMPDTPSLTYSAFSDSVPTKPHECKPPHVICHDYLTFDDSPASTSAVAAATAVASAAFTTVTSAFPPICALTSPGGIITDATISATQLSSTCWQKSGLPNDLHYTLFQDSEHPAITSNFFVIPSGGLRVAKFSDMLPNLNSTPGGVAETMVDASADQSRNHTDFSVGYLIGGDGSGVDGGDGGGHDCDGAMTELHVTSHSTLTPSSSAFGPFFASSVLPSLPTSDCLSLIPITSNFDDLQNTTDFSYNGYLL